MNLQVAKWGNSLALRIPSDLVRRFDLHEGDTVQARLTTDGGLSIRPANWSRAAFAAEMTAARESMSRGTSVIDEVRHAARY